MRRTTWMVLFLIAATASATAPARAVPPAGSDATTRVATANPTCRAGHATRIAEHQRRIDAVRREMGANELALKATRDPAEIAARLAGRADLRSRLARSEADRAAAERRSLAVMRICEREAMRTQAPRKTKTVVRHCRHVALDSRSRCR